ncbi:amino acid permease, putative [Talaromyces stipitatus ATCC 10500]|uniref:Amino acid permease, putative n=1 Tax=Talaromyces stipitatus (strain ATCC 10500 / CBS 375.48 / QM 6759 / NRRL 1006) TaxID=441959 RepID=B8MPB1_TALSN|nr:amino acid permease, putative [Talaromyces stipitatus ATCC 10500]EED14350.1 amino acid permease, putative [Talaromyces stipitatus ATCC 10500]
MWEGDAVCAVWYKFRYDCSSPAGLFSLKGIFTAIATHSTPEAMDDIASTPQAIYTAPEKYDPEMVTDSKDPDGAPELAEMKVLKKGLHQRHIQMIALAGTIGTGLFLGSGRALANAGPAGIFMGYALMGLLISGVTLSIGELSALVPLSGGVIRPAAYFVDPAFSFAQGWNVTYQYLISIPAEIVAASVIMQFWVTVNNAVWVTVFSVVLFVSNIFLVRIYGEVEFLLAILKILLIVGMNIMGLVLTAGGGPDHKSIGFQYWHDPGPFVQYLGYPGALGRFMGFWTVLSNAAYAYSSVETISMAAAETYAPRRNIPKAAKRVFIRVLLFYVISVFMITLLVPSNEPRLLKSSGTAAQSPFVIAAQRSGVKVVPHIINAIVLTSAWSSGNSTLLSGSRILYGLAREGQAPRFLARVSRWGVPYMGVVAIGVWMTLGYMSVSHTASTVFTWLQDLVACAQIMSWLVICTTYLRFYYAMRRQGISRRRLPWTAPFQPYAAWITLVGLTIILLTGGYTAFLHGHWSTETFISAYLDIGIFAALYFSYKIWYRTKIVSLDESPVARFVEIAEDDPDPVEESKFAWPIVDWLWA